MLSHDDHDSHEQQRRCKAIRQAALQRFAADLKAILKLDKQHPARQAALRAVELERDMHATAAAAAFPARSSSDLTALSSRLHALQSDALSADAPCTCPWLQDMVSLLHRELQSIVATCSRGESGPNAHKRLLEDRVRLLPDTRTAERLELMAAWLRAHSEMESIPGAFPRPSSPRSPSHPPPSGSASRDLTLPLFHPPRKPMAVDEQHVSSHHPAPALPPMKPPPPPRHRQTASPMGSDLGHASHTSLHNAHDAAPLGPSHQEKKAFAKASEKILADIKARLQEWV